MSNPSTAAAEVERETEPEPESGRSRRLSPEPRRTSRRRSREGVPARSTEAKDVLRECSGEKAVMLDVFRLCMGSVGRDWGVGAAGVACN